MKPKFPHEWMSPEDDDEDNEKIAPGKEVLKCFDIKPMLMSFNTLKQGSGEQYFRVVHMPFDEGWWWRRRRRFVPSIQRVNANNNIILFLTPPIHTFTEFDVDQRLFPFITVLLLIQFIFQLPEDFRHSKSVIKICSHPFNFVSLAGDDSSVFSPTSAKILKLFGTWLANGEWYVSSRPLWE